MSPDLTAKIEALLIAIPHPMGEGPALAHWQVQAILHDLNFLALFAEAQGQIDDAAIARGVKVFAQFGISRHGSADIVRAILLAALIPAPPRSKPVADMASDPTPEAQVEALRAGVKDNIYDMTAPSIPLPVKFKARDVLNYINSTQAIFTRALAEKDDALSQAHQVFGAECNAMQSALASERAKVERLEKRIANIKSLVVGDKHPRWSDDLQTAMTRRAVADICDHEARSALGGKETP